MPSEPPFGVPPRTHLMWLMPHHLMKISDLSNCQSGYDISAATQGGF